MKLSVLHRCCLVALLPLVANAQSAPPPGKPATEATKRANAAMAKQLDFNDKQDFEDAKHGLIARPDTLTIKDANGRVVWDMRTCASGARLCPCATRV